MSYIKNIGGIYMDEQMKILVNMLKERISNNLKVIKNEEEHIRIILTQPVSSERSALLAASFSVNKKLLAENHDSLNLELQLINYLSKFKEVMKHQNNNNQSSNTDNDKFDLSNFSDDSKEDQSIDNENNDLLNQTLNGELAFNSSHPKFNDEDFFFELFENFKRIENYEMCSFLLKMKEKK
ncbi:MAG: hypothetical protein AB9846_15780 [Tenuifilaceae bacterium]